MIKAVYFDFFNTLAYFEPSREEFYAGFANELGVKVTPEAIAAALPEADYYWRTENFKSPIREREHTAKYAAYTEYALRILKGAETKATPDQALQMLAKAFTMGFKFVAYSDALPVLQEMKARGLKTGLISNVGQEIDSYCEELGFASYLDFKVTSFEVGYDKPRPEIFQLALDKAGIKACDSLFIGDQYDQDIVGARGVGMNPILIDRKNGSAKLDCPVINSLSEVVNYLR
jgi:HAD superfamily hydrolase (TIGR01549 family)